MQKQEKPRGRALLAVSFGTTHEEMRRASIGAIEEDLAKAFPDRKLYRGWTSRMIVRRLREKGVSIDSLEDALERMQEDGMKDILVQPTHIIRGAENDRMLRVLKDFSAAFEKIAAGEPLLSSDEDLEQLAEILAEELLSDSAGDEKRFLVLMGHGSGNKEEANRIYRDMQDAFSRLGYDNVLVGTVEGKPDLSDVLTSLQQAGEPGSRVVLAPMMTVAGDHAKNDMASDGPDSWKSRIEACGFKAVPVLKGLGEYPGVRKMFCRHARNAEAAE